MATHNPYQQPGYPPAQPGAPQTPPAPGTYPQAQPTSPAYPQAAYPQGVPPAAAAYPQAAGYQQGYPQAGAYPQAQGYPQAAAYPQAAYPQAQAGVRPQAGGQPAGGQPPARRVLRGGEGDASGEEPKEDLTERAMKSTPPWLVSMAVHMVALIILGLIVTTAAGLSKLVSLDMSTEKEEPLDEELIYAEKLGNQTELDSQLAVEDTHRVVKPELSLSDKPPVDDPFAAPPTTEAIDKEGVAVSDIAANAIGLALEGREEGSKKALLGRYGGNATTEQAVIEGLKWLARQQQKDGSWSLSGPYTSGVPKEYDNPQSATAMALLAFQGHGETPKRGQFQKNVAEGWRWLSKQEDSDGNFFREGAFNHRYYTNGQCTIALCELLGMTKDEKYKPAAELAVKHLLKSQSPEGGWRYSANSDSDVSVTGWIVMALQSARMAKLEVPEENLRQIDRFLDKVAVQDGSRYPYQRGQEPKLSMTAEAILCRQYLGWKRSDPRMADALSWVTSDSNLVNFNRGRDAYYWYYATQACHHFEGDVWKKWNGVMRQALPEQQIKRGREAGSWDPERPSKDQWADHGGRLYVTCLSIYMLEVYYRHLPIYTKIYTNLLKSGRTPGT